MAVITSADSVISVTVTVDQDVDGIYNIHVTALSNTTVPIAIEMGGTRVYQGQSRIDAGQG